MNPEDFRSPRAGRVVRTPQGFWAFIPAALPPDLTYDADLVLVLSRADTALSELSGLGRHLPNPHLLIAPYVRREAVLSSRIEGTKTNLAELLLDEVEAGASEEAPSDVREVRNYVIALEHGIKRLAELPLSLRLVREIHAGLLKGVRGDYATPGEFRRSQNWIGTPDSTPATATYVPPPPEHMMDALSDWERFLHLRDQIPDLIQCALLHEQFEAIHPFLDGNGRVGRLLITLFLIERGRLSQPLLYLSAYFARLTGPATTIPCSESARMATGPPGSDSFSVGSPRPHGKACAVPPASWSCESASRSVFGRRRRPWRCSTICSSTRT